MITLAPAKLADVDTISSLLSELDRYYGDKPADPTPVRVRQIKEAIFGPRPAAHVLLAWDGDQLVGFASYSFLWHSVGVTQALFLKELYVIEASRRHAIGRILMNELSRIALENDCSRVEWHADTDNPTAQRFYATLGVPIDDSKLSYRLDGEALQQMASASVAGRPT